MSWWDEGGFGNVILIGSTTCGPPGSNGFTPMGFRSLRPAWRDDPSLSTDITASEHRKPRGRALQIRERPNVAGVGRAGVGRD